MATPASYRKHPIHPMLIVFPASLWVFSFIADLIHAFSGDPVWAAIAFRTLVGGIIGAVVAAVPGFIDFVGLEDRPKYVAQVHYTINLCVIILFTANMWLRMMGDTVAGPILSMFGVVGLGCSAWLGGELVYVHGIGVEPAERFIDARRSHSWRERAETAA